jgi:hypothetical protein
MINVYIYAFVYAYMRLCIHPDMFVYLRSCAYTHEGVEGGRGREGERVGASEPERERKRGHKAQPGSYFNTHMHREGTYY